MVRKKLNFYTGREHSQKIKIDLQIIYTEKLKDDIWYIILHTKCLYTLYYN